jgi:hypothetical protein
MKRIISSAIVVMSFVTAGTAHSQTLQSETTWGAGSIIYSGNFEAALVRFIF